MWRVFRRSAQGGARELMSFFSKYELLFLLRQHSKNTLGYSTRNGKFKRLEPHFQPSATRSGWKVTETAVALPHSRECTKEPIYALPNYGSKGKFGARAELRNVLQEKWRGRGRSSCRFDSKIGKQKLFLWAIHHR